MSSLEISSAGGAGGTEASPPEGDTTTASEEAGAVAEAPRPVIRVASPRLGGPLLYAAIGIPLAILSFAGAMLASRASAPAVDLTHGRWSYEGNEGPAHWGELDPWARTCRTGETQSPVDIHPSRMLQIEWLTPLQVKYKPGKVRLLNRDHTLHVAYESGSRLVALGQEYELKTITFRTPAEHTIRGRAADMEIQLMHTHTGGARQLGLSVLATEGPENQFLNKFWHQIPDKGGAELKPEITASALDTLPRDTRYYFYDGSLTYPPCTEGVNWVVLKETVTVSREQISRFKAIFGGNARPVQPIKERYIKEELPPER